MDVFSQLQALLTRHQARYRLIEHAAAGNRSKSPPSAAPP